MVETVQSQLISISLLVMASLVDSIDIEPHPCDRECIAGAQPVRCQYVFSVQWYQSMSKACYDCPYNMADCFRPECIPLDGVKRAIIAVNKTIPGPLIQACVGDMVEVVVENHLPDETTSVHWHGHHQRESPYMDGVPYVTQCPILPRTRFKYLFPATTPGTHFWHSHSGTQRGDGMFGGLIIRRPKSQDRHGHLYDSDLSEHTMTVLDWHHKMGVATFMEHHHSDGDNKPHTILVNGKGRFERFQSKSEDPDKVIYTPTAIFNVQQGKRYRFRLINAGFLNCPIEMSIDNHTITVINSDGSDIEPTEATSVVSYAGERWDFVLNAQGEIKNYWIRYRGLMDCDERFTKAFQVAILHYESAPDANIEEPEGSVTYSTSHNEGVQINPLNEGTGNVNTINIAELISQEPLAANDESLKERADMTHYLGYDFYPIDNPHYHKKSLYGFNDVSKKNRVLTPQLNHISMKLPSFPLLPQRNEINAGTFCEPHEVQNCTSKYCECTHAIHVPYSSVVELILVDEGFAYDANHPFHLHGHPFRVVAMERVGKNVTIEQLRGLDKLGLIKRNLKTAPLKDTVTVPDGGYTIIRFHATNPGYWLFHCHIEFHVEMGMAVVFKVGEDENMPPVPKGFPKCGDYMPSFQEELKTYTSSQTATPFSSRITTRKPSPPTKRIPSSDTSTVPFSTTETMTETSVPYSTAIRPLSESSQNSQTRATTKTSIEQTTIINDQLATQTLHSDTQNKNPVKSRGEDEDIKINDISSILQLLQGNIIKTEYRYNQPQAETTTLYNLLDTNTNAGNQLDSKAESSNDSKNFSRKNNLDDFRYALFPIEIKNRTNLGKISKRKNMSISDNEISDTLSTADKNYLKYNQGLNEGLSTSSSSLSLVLISSLVMIITLNYRIEL